MKFWILAVVLCVAPAALAQEGGLDVTAPSMESILEVGGSASWDVVLSNRADEDVAYRVEAVGEGRRAVAYVTRDSPKSLLGLDPATGEVWLDRPMPVSGYQLAFDGAALYVLDGYTLHRLDPVTGDLVASVDLDREGDTSYRPVTAIAVFEGRVLIGVQLGYLSSRVDEYDPTSGRRVRSLDLGLNLHSIAAGDGVLYVSGDAQSGPLLAMLDPETGTERRIWSFVYASSMTYSRTLDALLVVEDRDQRRIQVYDPETVTVRSTLTPPLSRSYDLFESVAADEDGGVPWLSVAPRAGTLAAGGDTTLTVSVDAGAVLGGSYEGRLTVRGFGPDTTETTLPVSLGVVGQPEIDVEPASVAFGTVYAGTPRSATVIVRNPGTDTLRVTAASSSDDRVRLEPSSFVVAPRDSLTVDLAVTPSGGGPLDATVTLATNVPGSEVTLITASATDLFPPVLRVDPASVRVSGAVGETFTTTIQIANDGTGDLDYDLGAGLNAAVVPARERSSTSVRAPARRAPEADRAKRGPSEWRFMDPPPLALLLRDEANGGTTDLLSIQSAVGPDTLFFAFDFATVPDELYALVFLDLDQDPDTGYRTFDTPLGYEAVLHLHLNYDPYGGYRYADAVIDRADGTAFETIPSVEVSGDTVLVGIPRVYLSDLGSAFDMIVRMDGGVFEGDFIVGGEDRAPNEGILTVHRGLGGWIDATPTGGTVSPGAQTDVAITLSGEGLIEGVYESTLSVTGNGPERQVVDVPVVFTVAGVPMATIEPVEFGTVYLGHEAEADLEVSNTGTGDLVISSVTASASEVNVAFPSETVVEPGDRVTIPVRLLPTVLGAYETDVRVSTNDPDGARTVSVTATVAEAPALSFDASPVRLAVNQGEATDMTLPLENTGRSALEFKAAVYPASVAGPASQTPTVATDPDEGHGSDLVEVRAVERGDEVRFELVFARFDASTLGGSIEFDADGNTSTGITRTFERETLPLGVEFSLDLFGVRDGRVSTRATAPPYTTQEFPIEIRGTTLSFRLPASMLTDEATFVSTFGGQPGNRERFPDAGVARLSPSVPWLTIWPTQGQLDPGAVRDLLIGSDAAALALGRYEAALWLESNDPTRPLLTVPVALDVVVDTPQEGGATPSAFALFPPSPNPTSEDARLRCDLPEAAHVRAEVIDAVGRRVLVLDEGLRPAGSFALDLRTAGLPSGVYTVRVRAGDEVGVQRLSVVR